MEKIQKRIKTDSIVIKIVVIVMILIAGTSIYDIIIYSQKDAAAFEVKKDKEWNGNYCLFIDGENCEPVDYNEFSNTDPNGHKNIQMCLIIQGIIRVVYAIFIAFIFWLASLILKGILDGKKPFSKKNITRLRWIAVTTMLIAVIPGAIKLILNMVTFNYAYGSFSQIDFFIFMIAGFIGIISEIFKYGYEIQEDVDQII